MCPSSRSAHLDRGFYHRPVDDQTKPELPLREASSSLSIDLDLDHELLELLQWWRNAKHGDLAMGHGDVIIFYFSSRNLFFPSKAAVLFVSNPLGAVPSPAARAHCTAPPRAPSPAADGELWLLPRM